MWVVNAIEAWYHNAYFLGFALEMVIQTSLGPQAGCRTLSSALCTPLLPWTTTRQRVFNAPCSSSWASWRPWTESGRKRRRREAWPLWLGCRIVFCGIAVCGMIPRLLCASGCGCSRLGLSGARLLHSPERPWVPLLDMAAVKTLRASGWKTAPRRRGSASFGTGVN